MNVVPCKIMIVTGEVSGDRQGALLAKAILKQDGSVRLVGVGGEQMRKAGVDVRIESPHLGCVGFSEAMMLLGALVGLYRRTQRLIRTEHPDVVVLVDNEGLNTILSRELHRRGTRVVFHFPPQAWLWAPSRALAVAKNADLILSAFQAEAEFYRQSGAKVVWTGHPVVDAVSPNGDGAKALAAAGLEPECPTLALMPGSRLHELRRLTPVMLAAGRRVKQRHPNLQIILPLASARWRPLIEHTVARCGMQNEVAIVTDEGYELRRRCTAALVKSGTGTLETAMLGVPMVVVYRLSALSYWLARRLARTRFMALPNILLEEEVVPELCQHDVTENRLAAEVCKILEEHPYAERIRRRLAQLRTMLGPAGSADRAGSLVLEEARKASARAGQ